MEMISIDISNIKEIEKRHVCCVYVPTFPLKHDVVCALMQVWAQKDIDTIRYVDTYEKKDYDDVRRYENVTGKTFDCFHDRTFRQLCEPRVYMEGYSQSCDCTIRMEFLEAENKIQLFCPNDYIINRFLLGGIQKERSLRDFNHLMDALEIEAYVFLTKEKEEIYVDGFR